MILEEQEHFNRLAPDKEHFHTLFGERHERHAVPPHTTPHNGLLSAGTFLPDRLDARPLAIQDGVSSTESYQGQDGVELLTYVRAGTQKYHLPQSGSRYFQARKPVATEGSVPVGSAAK